MLSQLARELYYFQIELPDTPLKSLNCYIIRPDDGGRSLLIDTGFHHPVCWETLRSRMKEARLQPENTDVFLTHAHADHTGNAAALHELGCRLFMSSADYRLYNSWLHDMDDETFVPRQLYEGLPPDLYRQLFQSGPVVQYNTSSSFPITELMDGDELQYGNFRLRCILTPGHTPGHLCLYDPGKEILFVGDHVLFDITPNISDFQSMKDPLGSYLESLRRIQKLPVSLALPAHRGFGTVSLSKRIDQILNHHEKRLYETMIAVQELQPVNAYEIAQHLRWKIRAESWDAFPVTQKWFALCETIAHLDYLRNIGKITVVEESGLYYYSISDD